VLLATIVVEGCAKDEETAPPARGVFAPAPTGRQQGADETTPTAASASAAGCEALGTLVGNGLSASLDSATRRSVAVPLVSRPTATRVAVQGVGASSDLSGKTIALGVAANSANDTCTHCLLIAVGCTGDDCSSATYYFPRSGTATFTAVASAAGQPFGGRFSDVILEHVTIDPATGATRAAGDDHCLYVKDLAFDALVPEESVLPPSDVDADVDGGGGTEDDGGSSTSSSGGGGTGKGGGGGGNGTL
jgi:uncharacterized membrane protein YgcG